MNKTRLIHPALLACCFMLVGCNVTPTTYHQWKKEQVTRAKFDAAGLPYKSPSELRAEAAEMQKLNENTTFTPAPK